MKNIIKYTTGIVMLLYMTACQEDFDPSSYAPVQSFGGFGRSSEIAPSNLVGHWSFENSLADSVSSTAGTVVNNTFGNGIKGQALQGAAGGYFITSPSDAIKNLQSFTVSLWVNVPQNTKGIYGLFSLTNTGGFWGNLDIFFENGSTANNAVLKAHIDNWKTATTNSETWVDNTSIGDVWNKWTHITLTYDQTNSTFVAYVNGSPVRTTVKAGNDALKFQNVSALIFGTSQFNVTPSIGTAGGAQPWADYVPGALDEIRIYNKSLTADEVKALWQLEKLGK